MFPIANLTVECKVKDQILLHLLRYAIHILHKICCEVFRSQLSCVLISRLHNFDATGS